MRSSQTLVSVACILAASVMMPATSSSAVSDTDDQYAMDRPLTERDVASMAWQSRANESLSQLREDFPRDFADAQLGESEFRVWFRDVTPIGAIAILDAVGTPYEIGPSLHFTELERLAAVAEIHANASNALSGEIVASTEPVTGTNEIRVILDQNATDAHGRAKSAVSADNTAARLDSSLSSRDGTPFNISVVTEVGATRVEHGYGHAGGSRIVPAGGIPFCTSGFVAKSTTSAELGVLTAGHCPDRLLENGAGGSYWFDFRGDHQGSQGDIQWLRSPEMMDSWFHYKPGLGRPVQRVATATTGTAICHFGASTLDSCGWVKATGVSQGNINRLTRAEGADLSGDGGDSGGPWFAGTTAYGIHSGGTIGGNPLYFTPVQVAENYFGVRVCIEGQGRC